jgi:hypothetical protein
MAGRPKKVQTETKPIEKVIKTENLPVDKIKEKYIELVHTESDINELLPYLYETSLACDHVTEFGVRRPTSTYAILAAHPKRVVSYDIGRYDEEVTEVEQLCKEANQNFEFIQKSVLDIEIEETDFLWTDTFHSYSQMKKELQLHAHKVRKFWGAHDWETFKHVGETWYPGVADFMSCNEGIYRAIMEFLDENKEWSIYIEDSKNNGIIILKRNGSN